MYKVHRVREFINIVIADLEIMCTNWRYTNVWRFVNRISFLFSEQSSIYFSANAFAEFQKFLQRDRRALEYCRHLAGEIILSGVFKVRTGCFHFVELEFYSAEVVTCKDHGVRNYHSSMMQNLVIKSCQKYFFQDDIPHIFAALSNIDEMHSDLFSNDNILYVQLVTTAGVHLVHPGMAVPEQYDPLQEAWFVHVSV